LIRLQHLGKRYPTGRDALRDISLEVPRGEMVFVTGHSGAGKSTLLRIVASIERATQGRAEVGGIDLGQLKRHQLALFRRQVGVVFQDHRLLLDRTVFDNVALPLVIAGYGHPEIKRRVRAALDKVDLLGHERSNPLALSGGEQQRVGIARAVVNRPALLLADEPTGNLDPALAREVMQLFVDFARVGVTVLVATHDVQLLRELQHRVVVLNEGRARELDRAHLYSRTAEA
jgi:cell division transport system ATP-binding protein